MTTELSTYPGAAENETNSSACMKDADMDGYGDSNVSGDVVAGNDCDDDDAQTNPDEESLRWSIKTVMVVMTVFAISMVMVLVEKNICWI